jgi:plasmid stabilization system protein ParE
MYEIIYLPIAKQDLIDIVVYVMDTLNAPKAALNLLNVIEKSILMLEEFPFRYRIYKPVKDIQNEYRLLPIKNYAVFYIVNEKEKIVEIRRVYYSKMDLYNLLVR